MPINDKTIKDDLYDFLKGQGFKPKRYDSDWNLVQVSKDASVFQAHFHTDGKDYGTFSIMVDGLKKLTVFYSDEIAQSPNTGEGISWTQLIKRLKKFAMNRQLGFDLDDNDNLEDVVEKRKDDNKQQLGEGYYGTRNTSYTDKQPSTIKIILKHSRPIGEGDQRFRNIEKIFLENEHGERILAPTTKPSLGRVFARCLAEGDEVNGTHWKHIVEMADEAKKLSGFLRATRNKQVNESVGKLINEAQAYYESLKSSIGQLQSSRGYNAYFESWKPQLNETEDGTSVLDMFRNNSVDPRVESALPILSRLSKNITIMQEVDSFANWADGIVNETLTPSMRGQENDLIELIGPDSELLPVGVDANNVIPQLSDIIQDDKLYARLVRMAKHNPDADARPAIIAWMEEHSNIGAYSKILDKLKSAESGKPEEPAKPAAPTPEPIQPPAPEAGPEAAPEEEPAEEPAGEVPPPLEEEEEVKKAGHPNDEEDLWDLGKHEQEFKSHKTSINVSKLPATFGKLDAMDAVQPGMVIADIGGGRFDNAIEWAKEKGAKLFIYDPFNRSAEHNQSVIGNIGGGKADIATCNNVLNVIKEPTARERVIKQVANVLKPGGKAFFLIYEGNKTGEGKPTQGNLSWQNNLPTRAYAEEIGKYFDSVGIKNGMLVASKGGSMEEGKTMKDRKDIPSSTPRNFVAKNAKMSGAGKHHNQGEYTRKEKHPQRELRRMEVAESPLARLKRLSGL